MGWVYPICVITNRISSPWGSCANSYGPHSLSGKPDSLANKKRIRDKSRKENWEEVGAGEINLGNGSEDWQKCHREGTVPEDLEARLVPAAFSSRGRGWKKVYTKSHWNGSRK